MAWHCYLCGMRRVRDASRKIALTLAPVTVVLATLLMPVVASGSPAAGVPHHGSPAGAYRAITATKADVDDFSFDSFHADYTLGRDESGRSTLHTVETFVVDFPETDQNRGFIRSLTWLYNGFDIDTRELSVTDERGAPRPFEYEYSSEFMDVIMAVPEGQFVHGRQAYVLEFVQSDTVVHFAGVDAGTEAATGTNTGISTGPGSGPHLGTDGFYWDLNGTDTRQPFGVVSATLTLADGVEAGLTGDAACYRGEFGSAEPCSITRVNDTTFSVSERDLGPGENVTIAVGFAPGTFVLPPEDERLYDPSEFADPSETAPTAGSSLGQRVTLWTGLAGVVGALALALTSLMRGVRDDRTGRAIIAEYDPPAGTSVALAADLMRAPHTAMTATLLDLAVQRKLTLRRDEAGDRYGAQAVDPSGLLPTENVVFQALFAADGKTAGGASAAAVLQRTEVWFGEGRVSLGSVPDLLLRRARAEGQDLGLYGAPGRSPGLWVPLTLALALELLTVWAAMAGFIQIVAAVSIAVLIALVWFVSMMVLSSRSARPRLTSEGRQLHDHLLGLKEYIRLAEADRIRMLQSAEAAELDSERAVRITERLLPYAVIFGHELEWREELARYYGDAPPEWIVGSSGIERMVTVNLMRAAMVPAKPVVAARTRGARSGGRSSPQRGSTGRGYSGGGGGGGGTRGI